MRSTDGGATWTRLTVPVSNDYADVRGQESAKRAMMIAAAGARLDEGEVDETAALIDFVAVCRTYASELAINEVTLRTYSDLQQYVEKSTEALVQSLRGGRGTARLALRSTARNIRSTY